MNIACMAHLNNAKIFYLIWRSKTVIHRIHEFMVMYAFFCADDPSTIR